MMRAIVVEHFGPPEVLQLHEVACPRPGDGEVLVQVIAAGVNPVDAGNRRDGSWAGVELPFVPGSDGSGVVVAVGPGVDDIALGDEVFYFSDPLGTLNGSYAEYQVVSAAIVAPKPRSVTHAEAASLPLAAGTAHEMVVQRLSIEMAERLLIVGAAGGVGAFAVQFAALRGASVTAVARAEHHCYLRELGASATIDYESCDPYVEAGEMDAVIDLVGGTSIERSLNILRPFGRAAAAVRLTGDFELAIDKNLTLHGILIRPERERLCVLARMVDSGALRTALREEIPLERAVDAHRLVESRHGRGKIVLRLRDEPGAVA
jgi:NADPH:quinone reductase